MIGKMRNVPWRSVVKAAATVAVLSPLMWAPQAAAASEASISQDVSYRIVTFADKCLTVRNESTEDGALIDQYPCRGLSAQRFTFHSVSGGRWEIRTFTNKCLTVWNESTADSALIDQYHCVDLVAQKFRIRPLEDGRVEILTFVDKCFTVRDGSTADSALIDQYPCRDLYAQRFRLEPVS
ncbi:MULTISPECIES: RICIN domain-containing protein [unclassified Streptomyces]|uniref:RICIN domain-containing protein n=1 Tax=unclassified Streptomyces TaxID=2593676 RepID=UPI00344EB529